VAIPSWWADKKVLHRTIDPSSQAKSSSVSHPEKKQSITLNPLEKMTRSKLLEHRRRENIPDISYDLDGDGNVGGRDYVVARRFDNGFKNYLTDEERQKAFEALNNVS